jgi:hypothetical protein
MNNLNARTRLRAVPCCPLSPTGIRPEMARSIALSVVDRLVLTVPLAAIDVEEMVEALEGRGFSDIQDMAAICLAAEAIIAERRAALPPEPPPAPQPAPKARRQPRRRRPVQLSLALEDPTEARG